MKTAKLIVQGEPNMKKMMCLLLAICMIIALAACGKQAYAEIKEWTRQGYFMDENENILSVIRMDDVDEPGWYVGVMLGEDLIEDSWGGISRLPSFLTLSYSSYLFCSIFRSFAEPKETAAETEMASAACRLDAYVPLDQSGQLDRKLVQVGDVQEGIAVDAFDARLVVADGCGDEEDALAGVFLLDPAEISLYCSKSFLQLAGM